MFLSGPATTVYDPNNPEVKEQIRAINFFNEVFQPAALPRSQPKWSPNDYLEGLLGKELLDNIPTIGITSGSTDYLDLVKPNDFVDSNGNNTFMAKGICPFGRHFVTFGLELTNVETQEKKKYIYTVFRRYTSADSSYVICKSHFSSSSDGQLLESVLNISTLVTTNVYNTLKKLFDNFKSGNSGIDFEYEDTADNTKMKCTVKFCQPNNI